jgi:hypothetical protein
VSTEISGKGVIMAGGMVTDRRGAASTDTVNQARSVLTIVLPGSAARIVRQSTIGCAYAALLSGTLLLIHDVAPSLTGFVSHGWLAACALLLAGVACFGLASAFGARARDVVIRYSLGTAFILWAVQQLLPESRVSLLLGDVVIVLFVVDLGALLENTVQTRIRVQHDGAD